MSAAESLRPVRRIPDGPAVRNVVAALVPALGRLQVIEGEPDQQASVVAVAEIASVFAEAAGVLRTSFDLVEDDEPRFVEPGDLPELAKKIAAETLQRALDVLQRGGDLSRSDAEVVKSLVLSAQTSLRLTGVL